MFAMYLLIRTFFQVREMQNFGENPIITGSTDRYKHREFRDKIDPLIAIQNQHYFLPYNRSRHLANYAISIASIYAGPDMMIANSESDCI